MQEIISDYLSHVAPSESLEGLAKRAGLVRRIELLAIDWLSSLASSYMNTQPPQPLSTDHAPKLLCFGSSLLGVLTPESDIDTVLVLPQWINKIEITRDMVFSGGSTGFVKRLTSSHIADFVSAIPDAHVPVIKLVASARCGGYSVDVLIALVPPDLLKEINNTGEKALLTLDSMKRESDRTIIEELDTPSLLSLNGVRVGELILVVVKGDDDDDGERITVFQNSLRVVKHWAHMRGIYSNAMGFFGGITWAILLAKAVQTLENKDFNESELLNTFFRIFNSWQWGSGCPVFLKPLPPSIALAVSRLCKPLTINTSSAMDQSIIDDTGDESSFIASAPQQNNDAMWDPSSSDTDKKSLMPILTPASPFMNSTFGTLSTNFRILKDEFRRGHDICTKHHRFEQDLLKDLCQSAYGESRYPLALVIKITVTGNSDAEKTRRLFNWQGLVESKLRVLLTWLEKIPGLITRPFPDPPSHKSDNCLESEFIVGLAVPPAKSQKAPIAVDLTAAVDNFKNALSISLEAREDCDDLIRNSRLKIFAKHQV